MMEIEITENAAMIVDWMPFGFSFSKCLKCLFFNICMLRSVF